MYRRIQTLEDLQAAVQACESPELDFKVTIEPTEWWELAKDIAAFANYLGGTILVGANEQSSGSAILVGVERQDAMTFQIAYENAARDKCLPRPIVSCVVLEPEGTKHPCVLAVNVEPFPDQFVGAMYYRTNKQGDPTTCDAWRLPIRIGKHNVLLTPDKLPMFIDARIRRIAIRLSAIPSAATPLLVWRRPSNQSSEEPVEELVFQVQVDLQANVLRARRADSKRGTVLAIPLDDVEAVWEHGQADWRIRVTGWLEERKGYICNPSNTVIKR